MTQSVIVTTVAKRRAVRSGSPRRRSLRFHGARRPPLPQLGDNGDLDLALLDVEDGICRVSLREDCLIFPIARHAPPAAHGAEEHLDVEGLLVPFLRHRFPFL
jgi:hypothetical protein